MSIQKNKLPIQLVGSCLREEKIADMALVNKGIISDFEYKTMDSCLRRNDKALRKVRYAVTADQLPDQTE